MEINRKEVNAFIKNVDRSKLQNNVYEIITKFYSIDGSDCLNHITEELLLQTLSTAEDWKLNSLINAICHIIANKIKRN